MCSQDNNDSFGAPQGGALRQMFTPRPTARGPARPTGLAAMVGAARGSAAPAEPTGLASLTPSARGPRNRASRV